VRVDQLKGEIKVYSVPATRMAEDLGKRMVLNSVMVGFFTAVTHLLEPDAVAKAVEDSVPPSFREINLRAFQKGHEYGSTAQAGSPASLEMEPHLIYSED